MTIRILKLVNRGFRPNDSLIVSPPKKCMNTVHRLAQAFGCYSKLTFMAGTFNRRKLFSYYANITFSHSNIVFKIKVTKIAQKMLFSKNFVLIWSTIIVYLISGRAVGLLDGTITTDVTLTVLQLCP